MTDYITVDEALRIHVALIEAFGGASGVRDLGLLEFALLRPQTGYYSDLIEEAAALWESLAMNHRSWMATSAWPMRWVELFLQVNGLRLSFRRTRRSPRSSTVTSKPVAFDKNDLIDGLG